MGLFLSMTGVIGKTENEVSDSLLRYAESAGGGIQKASLSFEDNNCGVIAAANSNVTILYPSGFYNWDECSAFLSHTLGAPVFSLHIHDGVFWMYTLYIDGVVADRFNPIPDYWEEMSEAESEQWKGNATMIAQHVGTVEPAAIEKYLVRWDLEGAGSGKAYPDDEFRQEDWQLLDFMKKLGLPYPLEDNGSPDKQTFKLWTADFPVED